ncbi:MAG TPA: XRE family transcriptional regulator [Morganella sp. (in: Bacteria)]|nr:XRE family transcriptional regulator [Morganella sp. (in: enterobacteria)]
MKTIDITTYRINRLLKENGWSQSDLAKKLGVTQQTIQKWVRGKASPSMDNIDKLVELTDLPSHWFMLPPDEGDQVVTPDSIKIGPTQLDLLKTFNAFPEEDQAQMLQEMKEKKESMDKTVERWLAAQKGRRA